MCLQVGPIILLLFGGTLGIVSLLPVVNWASADSAFALDSSSDNGTHFPDIEDGSISAVRDFYGLHWARFGFFLFDVFSEAKPVAFVEQYSYFEKDANWGIFVCREDEDCNKTKQFMPELRQTSNAVYAFVIIADILACMSLMFLISSKCAQKKWLDRSTSVLPIAAAIFMALAVIVWGVQIIGMKIETLKERNVTGRVGFGLAAVSIIFFLGAGVLQCVHIRDIDYPEKHISKVVAIGPVVDEDFADQKDEDDSGSSSAPESPKRSSGFPVPVVKHHGLPPPPGAVRRPPPPPPEAYAGIEMEDRNPYDATY